MKLIGIDPGLDGAVAIIHTASGLVLINDTPITTMTNAGGKKKRTFLAQEMADLLIPFEDDDVHVFIEQVGAMPKQGVSSVFSFGRGYGIWIGITAALRLPTTFVTPQRWKKVIMDGIADKNAARLRAQQLFPAVAPAMKLVKHDGRAEALLIAEYGRRSLGLQFQQKELPLKKR
jgi:crossover junction endodeoxyribonuclease RuvC